MDGQPETTSQLPNVPSNGQLVHGLMGTIITLSSTLYQAIEGDDGRPEILLQSLLQIRERLERLLIRIESQETKAQRIYAETRQTPQSARSLRPQTATHHPTNGRDVMFAPAASSTAQETEPKAGINSKPSASLAATNDQSFVPPPGWHEITNLETFMAESGGVAGERSEILDASGDKASEEVASRMDTFDRKTFTIDSKRTQRSPTVSGAVGHGRSRSEGQPFAFSTPKHTVDKLFKAGTYAVRETSNYALPDGSFQRNTKTIAGPDASVLAKCSQPLLTQNAMLSQAEVLVRAPILPSAPPEDKMAHQVAPCSARKEE